VPVAERPRRGSVALVVPRRDALPEVVPLLCSHDLGVSWLISVGDADPAEVVRFLAIDPATTGVLLALGRGVRAPTLHGALGHKPVVVLEPPGLPLAGRDPALHRAVARRAGVPIVQDLEEWLAHGILLEAGALPLGPAAEPERRGRGPARARAAIVVVGAGADLVSSEAGRAGLPAPVKLDIDDPQAVAAALHKTAQRAELVVLCGPSSDTAELKPPLPTLRVDPAQPERLRALLRAVALPPRQPDDHQPVAATGDAARVQTVLADLPPPLYLSGAVVSDEPLGDHDCKRLLHAYGVQVSRQAPVNTSTAALRVLTKLGLPVLLVPPQAPAGDGLAAALAEERAATLCTTQAEVKRHATLLLAKHPYILLREVIPAGPRLRALVSPERGLGPVLRLARVRPGPGPGPGPGEWSAEADWQAALVPLRRGEARELAGLLMLRGEFGKAHELYTELLKEEKDSELLIAAARAERLDGAPEKALTTLLNVHRQTGEIAGKFDEELLAERARALLLVERGGEVVNLLSGPTSDLGQLKKPTLVALLIRAHVSLAEGSQHKQELAAARALLGKLPKAMLPDFDVRLAEAELLRAEGKRSDSTEVLSALVASLQTLPPTSSGEETALRQHAQRLLEAKKN